MGKSEVIAANFTNILVLKGLFFCVIAFLSQVLIAQQNPTQPLICGVPEPDSLIEIPDEMLNDCFDVDSVIANCTKVWIRVNIHYFLDDTCGGSVDPLYDNFWFNPQTNQSQRLGRDISARDGITEAQLLIDEANYQLENNRTQWAADQWGLEADTVRDCIPFRYLLSGVYFHCNTAQRNNGVSGRSTINALRNNYGVNTDSEINIFIIEHTGATGEANGYRGNTFVTEVFNRGTFNHEMGHILDLRHSWLLSDSISDTPAIHFTYDFNCDGDKTDNWNPGVGSESSMRQCWVIFEPPTYALDYNGDGNIDIADACDPPSPCEVYPCCDWKYGNNNLMSYSAYVDCCGAFTAGQIRRMMQTLSAAQHCAFIEYIGSECPPPSANINLLPRIDTVFDCSYCLYLEASMNEAEYLLEFFEVDGNDTIPHHSTGWLPGPADVFCISRNTSLSPEYHNGFEAGVTYMVRLIVENDCDEQAIKEATFTLPSLVCHQQTTPTWDVIFSLPPTPNPHTNGFDFEYDLSRSGHLRIILTDVYNPANLSILENQPDAQAGSYQKTVNTSLLSSGLYALIVQFDGITQSFTIVKQ